MYKIESATSRREFVKDFVITSGALALGLSLRPTALAQQTPHSAGFAEETPDSARKLDLPVAPSPDEPSGVICKPAGATYLVFKAIQIDDEDRPIEGTAVVELVGCCGLATAYPDNDLVPQPGRPRYFAELESAAVYEIENSSWLRLSTRSVDRCARSRSTR